MSIGVAVEFNFEIPPGLDPENVDTIADEIVQRAAEIGREEWERLAGENLKLTKETYVDAISPVERPNEYEAVITLEGELPNMLEQGAESFDMKPGLLSGEKAKLSKSGSRYVNVRFVHGSPNPHTPGLPAQTKSKALPKEIFKTMQSKPLGWRYTDKNKLKNWNMGRPGGYEHKAGIFEGLHKARDKGTGTIEMQTFRRVSDNSDPSAFIHPGLKALHLAEKVKDHLENQLDSIIEQVMGENL